jgi:hypothetical protein
MVGHEGKSKILRSWDWKVFILMHCVCEECKLILINVTEGGCGLMYMPRPSSSILIPTANCINTWCGCALKTEQSSGKDCWKQLYIEQFPFLSPVWHLHVLVWFPLQSLGCNTTICKGKPCNTIHIYVKVITEISVSCLCGGFLSSLDQMCF